MTNHTLRTYAILPPVPLNLWAVLLHMPYYALVYTRPNLVTGVTPGQLTFINSAFLTVVEWALALSMLGRLGHLGRDGMPLRQLL